MGRSYRTMQGREVDMDKLMSQNELMPAIGNIKVNARGDELGPGGKIIRKREEVLAEYYENNPKALKSQSGIVQAKSEDPTLSVVKQSVNSKKSKPLIEDDDESQG